MYGYITKQKNRNKKREKTYNKYCLSANAKDLFSLTLSGFCK